MLSLALLELSPYADKVLRVISSPMARSISSTLSTTATAYGRDTLFFATLIRPVVAFQLIRSKLVPAADTFDFHNSR